MNGKCCQANTDQILPSLDYCLLFVKTKKKSLKDPTETKHKV